MSSLWLCKSFYIHILRKLGISVVLTFYRINSHHSGPGIAPLSTPTPVLPSEPRNMTVFATVGPSSTVLGKRTPDNG